MQSWLESLPTTARVLDYGCGYGRTLAELRDVGWRNAVGVDFSREMVSRVATLSTRTSIFASSTALVSPKRTAHSMPRCSSPSSPPSRTKPSKTP